MDRPIDRRLFLGGGAAALGYFYTADALSAARAADTPSEKLRFAGIGIGGKGDSDITHAGNLGDVVAICDIDEARLDKKNKQFPNAKRFFDFRKMLDEMAKEIDAVTISTPDHTHAVAAVQAIRMKKHAYVQKPLTHFVFEARVLREAARKYGVCTQMGNQGSAENGLRRAVEIVQHGIIGPVKEVHVWTNRPIWPQAPKVMKRPEPAKEVPAGIHWDEFLGPAPERPYASGYHPFAWRGWWDFGTGAIGDMACHTANMAFRALKLGHPKTLVAEAGDVNPETCPSWAHVTMEFPERDGMPACVLHWYEGQKNGQKVLPPEELLNKVLNKGEKLSNSGSLLVGEKGILFSPNDYGAAFRLVGVGNDTINLKTPEKLPQNGKGDQGMKDEWVQAIRSNKPELAYSNFDIASLLTEAFLLGNVAIRTGKKIEWDGPNCRVSNSSEAQDLVRGVYRKGWEVTADA
jgi:predicted dehydrogenase